MARSAWHSGQGRAGRAGKEAGGQTGRQVGRQAGHAGAVSPPTRGQTADSSAEQSSAVRWGDAWMKSAWQLLTNCADGGDRLTLPGVVLNHTHYPANAPGISAEWGMGCFI